MTATDPKRPPAEVEKPLAPTAHEKKRSENTRMAAHRSNPVLSILIWVVVLAGLVAVGLLCWHYYETSQAKAQQAEHKAKPPVPVIAQKAVIGDMKIYIDRVGTVMAYSTVTLRSRVDGQLMKVAFKEGQKVKEGDLLFEIDPRPYQVQLEQAEGQLAKDQTTLANAQRDLVRYQKAEAAVSGQQIDTAKAAVGTAEGTVKSDQAAIDSAKLNLVYCTIKAPISGKIGFRMVDEGNLVHASDATGMAVITQVQPIAVFFSPTQDSLPAVQKAMAANPDLVVEAWDPTITTKLATGKLEALDNQIDPTTGTFKAKAVFPNEDDALYPNQFVNVRMLVDTLKGVVLVPNAAIQASPSGSFVYRVKPDNSVEMVQVTTAQFDDKQTVIDHGISGGDLLVTDGADKLEPGSKVVPHGAGESATQSATGAATRGARSRPAGTVGVESAAPGTQSGSGARGGGRKKP